MSKRKLSSVSFSERIHSGLRFSASASNLHGCTSPSVAPDPPCGLFGQSSSVRNLFRIKKSNGKSSYKRSTLGSVWDLRSSTNYRVSTLVPSSPPPYGRGSASALVGWDRLFSSSSARLDRSRSKAKSHSVGLVKAQSARLLGSQGPGEDKAFKRLKLLWRHRHKLRSGGKMLEDRRARIIMPWGTASLEVLVEHKTLTCDLLDTVASKCKLVERSYFGLAWKDSTKNQLNWLQLDKKVLDHDLPKSGGFLVLHFAVRFYVDTYSRLQTTTAVELLYLQSKEHVFKGDLVCSDEEAFKLAALVLQETCGDYTDDESTRKVISKYPLLPSFVLQRHPSIGFCEKRILEYYKSLSRNTRGLVIADFLTIVESLPSYGTHYYRVKDKEGMPWWLGMNRKGIAVYDSNDRSRPRKLFKWDTIENIFYRDKKFCLEVINSRRVINKVDSSNIYDDAVRDNDTENHDELALAMSDPATQVSISKRVYGPSTVDVHHWICPSAQVTESIWCMAVSQHKFSIEMALGSTGDLRSNEEIVKELNSSAPLFSEAGWTDHSQPAMDLALETKKILSSAGSDAEILEKAKQQLKILKDKKLVLNDNLAGKVRELKRLCLEEANLIGELPKEYPLEEGESVPRVKKRVGTSYCLNVGSGSSGGSGEMSQEMLEYEIQDKITKAALVLAQEERISKNIRKNRIETYRREWKKLKAMESNLKHMSKNVKAKEDTGRKLRSMAEPTRSSPAASESRNRRSMEALPIMACEDQPRSRLNSLKQDRLGSGRLHSPPSRTSRGKSHKSAPSSPTLPRIGCHPHRQYDHQHSRYEREDVLPVTSNGDKFVMPLEIQHQGQDDWQYVSHQSGHHLNHHHQQHHHHPYAFPPHCHGCHSHSRSPCPSASFVIPMSADPRITSRNFAAGYGLLACENSTGRWGPDQYDSSSQEGSSFGGKYHSQILDPRSAEQALGHSFSRLHIADNLSRYRSDSSSTLSSSSGGAGGSTHSCNKPFSKSSAYPTPLQVGGHHKVSLGEFLNSSSSSMSSSNNFDQQFSAEVGGYFSYGKWGDPARKGMDYFNGIHDRTSNSMDSGYEASVTRISSTPPVQFLGHPHPYAANTLACPASALYKRETTKPFETSDISKYSEGRRFGYQSQDVQRLRHHPTLAPCGSFSSNSSTSSSSSLYGGASRYNQVGQEDRRDITLTRDNVGEYYQKPGKCFMDNSFIGNTSRSRKPILGSSDASMDVLSYRCEGSFQGTDGRQRYSDSSETGSASKETVFNPFEAKVSQEFETEMLHWYDMCGVTPRPDDKFTLV